MPSTVATLEPSLRDLAIDLWTSWRDVDNSPTTETRDSPFGNRGLTVEPKRRLAAQTETHR